VRHTEDIIHKTFSFVNNIFSKVTIHGTATCIRKSSQQAVCRFYEALSFAHVGGGSCFTGSLHQQIFAYVQAQHSNLLMQATVNSNFKNHK
jgi:hypothetical protein